MKKVILALCVVTLSAITAWAQWKPAAQWPILTHFDQTKLNNLSMPIGGIGTGTLSLAGNGELCDLEITNRPDFNYQNSKYNAPVFAIYAKPANGEAKARLLNGRKNGASTFNNLPCFEVASFDAAYPFAQVKLVDNSMPVQVTIKGFNPFIPTDENSSGIPMVALTYEVKNTGTSALEVSVCGILNNIIGYDFKATPQPAITKNNTAKHRKGTGFEGIYMENTLLDNKNLSSGTIALTTNAVKDVSFRTALTGADWTTAVSNLWNDFSSGGVLQDNAATTDAFPASALSVKKTIAPNSTESFTFFLTWNFPNRPNWNKFPPTEIVANYYSADYPNAWAVMEKTITRLPELEKNTLAFVNTFLSCSFPQAVKEAALFNLAKLRSPSVFRIPSGHLYAWEGVTETNLGYGTNHSVWNYDMATPYLFGKLSMGMREVEFNFCTEGSGLMSYKASLPLPKAGALKTASAEGQMGAIMKFFRDYHLSGDNKFLYDNWEVVKLSLRYAWKPDMWDRNVDGVMETEQLTSFDVNFYGPNPHTGFLYLGALRATQQIAFAQRDREYDDKCNGLYKKGSKWVDENLFNGEYYEQKIANAKTFAVLQSTVNAPANQIGKGCLVDQLVGQNLAYSCGLGDLTNADNITKTLQSIVKNNTSKDAANPGLITVNYNKVRLKTPLPHAEEAISALEYSAATGMLYKGMTDEGVKCVENVRKRFDGTTRNPFNEGAYSPNYATPLAAWGTVLGMTEFSYSAVNKSMSFTGREGTWFWSTGYAWGTCTIKGNRAELNVMKGTIELTKFIMPGKGEKATKEVMRIREGSKRSILVEKAKGGFMGIF